MGADFEQLTAWAGAGDPAFAAVPRAERVAAARAALDHAWAAIRARHEAGESGASVLRRLTAAADAQVRGLIAWALYESAARAPGRPAASLLKHAALCALGGYARGELSPHSDLDLALLLDGPLTPDLHDFNAEFSALLWDSGFHAAYAVHTVEEAAALAESGIEAYTSFAQARMLRGDTTAFARLKLKLGDIAASTGAAMAARLARRGHGENLPSGRQDLHAPEPDIKENAGGLRDYHAAMWMLHLRRGVLRVEDLETLGYFTPEEHLALAEALDLVWRIRNELHFHTGRAENRLTFDLQRHVARVFGYGGPTAAAMDRLMADYYTAARRLRRFVTLAAHLCDNHLDHELDDAPDAGRAEIVVHRGELCAGMRDRRWFAEYPPRLMELFLECARHRAPLSVATERRVRRQLHLVNDAFRANDVVRRYFLAICNRVEDAGFALRQAARAGLLGAYLPEFAAIEGLMRYEDFHSYPVDEHTLRAVEALGAIPAMDGGHVGAALLTALEELRAPGVLVLATLLHDLGKAGGHAHVEAGARIAETVCRRIGLPPEDRERVVFLVEKHMLMTHIGIYRDTDDVDIVAEFANTMKSDERLRMLFLLSHADLSAVGPNVWTDWKGMLLAKLYFQTERVLLGRAPAGGQAREWKQARMAEAIERAPAALRPEMRRFLRGMSGRYFAAFTPERMARHLGCLEAARRDGVALLCMPTRDARMSEMVVCTRDRHGLFADIAGVLTAQMLDVNAAALFTTADGYTVDCFTVTDAMNRRAPTPAQHEEADRALRAVLGEGKPVAPMVDQARRRLFALQEPRAPGRTRVEFDNAASRTDTVIDVETGDRAGLLYDMARALSGAGVDIFSARAVTDARRVRDAFYVRKDDCKLEDATEQETVRCALETAIAPRDVAEVKEV